MKTITVLFMALLFTVFSYGQNRTNNPPRVKANQHNSGIFKKGPINTASSSTQNIIKIDTPTNKNTKDVLFPIYESFEGTFPPDGWTTSSPDGGTGWEQQTNGTTPVPGFGEGTIDVPTDGGEKIAFCGWHTGGSTNNDQWLISPQVSITSPDDVLTFFVRKYANYADNIEILVSTTNNETSSFSSFGFIYWAAEEGFDWTIYGVPLGYFDGEQIYIAFREFVADNQTDGAAVMLDLVAVQNLPDLDLSLTSIDTPLNFELNDDLSITGLITNLGSTTNINSFYLTYNINNGVESNIYSVSGLDIEPEDTYSFTHDEAYNFNTIGEYEINVTISNVNGVVDDYLDNNTLSKNINIVPELVTRKPLHEIFTTSTQEWSIIANTTLDPIALSFTNIDDCTLIRYPLSWIADGDPYYIPAVNERFYYYDASAFPWLAVDGERFDPYSTYSQENLNNYMQNGSFFNIEASHTIINDNVSVDINIHPLMNFEGKCRIAIVEKQTTGNASINGETEFHNVLMKMLPDASGTDIILENGIPYNFQLSGNMAETFVEEMSDLEVVVFVQDETSREVMQSTYSTYKPDLILSDAHVTNSILDDCLLSTEETLSIEISNLSPFPVSNIDVSYSIDGNTPVQETISGNISSMESVFYSFNQTANLLEIGCHEILFTISHDDDINTYNNTLTKYAVSGDEKIDLSIVFDYFAASTSWELVDNSIEEIIASGSDYTNGDYGIDESICVLSTHCYTFTIFDEYGDGICCLNGQGEYTINYLGEEVATGGSFSTEESVQINAISDLTFDDIVICQGENIWWETEGIGIFNHQAENLDNITPQTINIAYTINEDEDCETTSYFNITVLETPEVDILIDGNLILSTDVTGSFQWYLNGIAIDGATESTYQCAEDGNYYLIVTYDNNCYSQSTTITITGSPVELNPFQTVKVFPNPTSGLFTISNVLNSDVYIYNLVGQLIRSFKCTDNNIDIHTDEFTSGTFFIKIIKQEKTIVKQIIISK